MTVTALPARTAAIILSGGFPEVYAAPLAANRALHIALHVAHRDDTPIYAECGGLMYLTQAIVDADRREHPMVGLLPGRCSMGGKVTQTPSEDELRRLFEERKDYEPDPKIEEPGFREPRKVKVEAV